MRSSRNPFPRQVIGWLVFFGLLLGACAAFPVISRFGGNSYASNGERIYFTGVNADGERIGYSGGPGFGGMMGGRLACASCHGENGEGGSRVFHMQVVRAPAITYAALSGEAEAEEESADGHVHGDEGYNAEDFYHAVVLGQHPDGEPLDANMPRWKLSEGDAADLFEFIQTLP